MLDHYREIWKRLDKEKFVICYLGRMDSGSGEFDSATLKYKREIFGLSYNTVELSDLLRSRTQFRWVISHHKLGRTKTGKRIVRAIWPASSSFGKNRRKGREGSKKTRGIASIRRTLFTPEVLGQCQIRMMYGADLNHSWSLGEWNEIYSYVLCHGPRDAQLISQNFEATCYQIGYPKYDRHFNDPDRFLPLREEFDLSPKTKVVLWLPTAGSNSIEGFWKVMANLTKSYQVICRPHPLSLNPQSALIEKLRSHGIIIDTYEAREMVELLDVADFLFTDSGGSPFGGLYLNMRVVRMVDSTISKNELHQDSTNLDLEHVYPAISPEDSLNSVRNLLEDEDLWRLVLLKARGVRDEFFGPYDGVSADRAVSVLEQITHLQLRPGAP